MRGIDTRLQHLQHQHIRRFQIVARVRRELTDLIDLSAVCKLIRYRQHLVLVQCRFKRYISQGTVERIFAARQQSR